MKTKHCTTFQQAERYQNWLYDRYDSVRLIRFPRFSEYGLYVWEVR